MFNKMIILGSNGMLGQMVKNYFRLKGFEIFSFDKRFDENSIHNYVSELNEFNDSVIVNCIGRIKQKSNSASDLFLSNTIFPLELARSLKLSHLLIHPSSDCVFDGLTSTPYLSFDKHTASDIYGISKSLGETAIFGRSNSLVIRVSIIGPDKNSNKGLLSWFLSTKPNSELNGFVNHLWNGITTLEWCERVSFILRDQDLLKKLLERKIIQLGTDQIYSKFNMLSLFNLEFEKNISVIPFEDSISLNRCLKPDITSKPLEVQIESLNNYIIDNF